MKIEPRGKYAGVKVHLDAEESEVFLRMMDGTGTKEEAEVKVKVLQFGVKLGKKIRNLISEHPNLLAERTPEEIEAALLKEKEQAEIKLEKVKKGEKWNG